jgi:hypothetical protein
MGKAQLGLAGTFGDYAYGPSLYFAVGDTRYVRSAVCSNTNLNSTHSGSAPV